MPEPELCTAVNRRFWAGRFQLVLILAGMLFPGNFLGAQVKVKKRAGHIEAATRRYVLVLDKQPFRLSVERLTPPRKVVLASPAQGAPAGTVTIGSVTLPFGDVQSFSAQADELELRLSTPRQGTAVICRMRLNPERIDVRVRVEGLENVDRLGENFLLASAGHWFGGDITAAYLWPLETHEWSADPFLATSNQASPFWMTSSGVGIFLDTYGDIAASINRDADGLFRFAFLHASTMDYTIFIGQNISEARDAFAAHVGKPRKRPPDLMFERPIWCTWTEHLGKETQANVLEYAHHIHAGGWPAGIIVIDDGWAKQYGDFEFKSTFPDPKAMVDEIHSLGYRLSLWVCNFVSPESERYKAGSETGYLLRDAATSKPAIIHWWNGPGGLVDFNNPTARNVYLDGVKSLMQRYGVDGFKFDGGDAEYWPPAGVISAGGPLQRNRYTDLFAELGAQFELNELRVGWRSQPFGAFNRMRDKASSWSEVDGLPATITHGGIQSLLGFVFDGPDLVGGGLDQKFGANEELTVRCTQASAFMPIMQFSYGPWKFSEPAQKIMKEFIALHGKLWPIHFKPLADRAMKTGKPVWSPLFYVFPEDEKVYFVKDEFMVGETLLVAPVIQPGARERDVYLPVGTWRNYWSGELVQGGTTLGRFPAPLERIPVFERLRPRRAEPTGKKVPVRSGTR